MLGYSFSGRGIRKGRANHFLFSCNYKCKMYKANIKKRKDIGLIQSCCSYGGISHRFSSGGLCGKTVQNMFTVYPKTHKQRQH